MLGSFGNILLSLLFHYCVDYFLVIYLTEKLLQST